MKCCEYKVNFWGLENHYIGCFRANLKLQKLKTVEAEKEPKPLGGTEALKWKKKPRKTEPTHSKATNSDTLEQLDG